MSYVRELVHQLEHLRSTNENHSLVLEKLWRELRYLGTCHEHLVKQLTVFANEVVAKLPIGELQRAVSTREVNQTDQARAAAILTADHRRLQERLDRLVKVTATNHQIDAIHQALDTIRSETRQAIQKRQTSTAVAVSAVSPEALDQLHKKIYLALETINRHEVLLIQQLNETASGLDRARVIVMHEKLAQRVTALEFSSTDYSKRAEECSDHQHATSLQPKRLHQKH